MGRGDALDTLIAAAESDLQPLVARIIIDSLGRAWNSALHPRDRHGRFIETFAELRGGWLTPGGAERDTPLFAGRAIAGSRDGTSFLVQIQSALDEPGNPWLDRIGEIHSVPVNDLQTVEPIARIVRKLNDTERIRFSQHVQSLSKVAPDAAAEIQAALDTNDRQQQMAHLDRARDLLDANPDMQVTPQVRDDIWNVMDDLGERPTEDEAGAEAARLLRDHPPIGVDDDVKAQIQANADDAAKALIARRGFADYSYMGKAVQQMAHGAEQRGMVKDAQALRDLAVALDDAHNAPNAKARARAVEQARAAINQLPVRGAAHKRLRDDLDKLQRRDARIPYPDKRPVQQPPAPAPAPEPKADLPEPPAPPDDAAEYDRRVAIEEAADARLRSDAAVPDGFAPDRIYRGVRIDLPKDLADRVQRALEMPENIGDMGQHFDAGEAILDYLLSDKVESDYPGREKGLGIGAYWSTRREMAKAAQQQGGGGRLGVIVEGYYDPSAEVAGDPAFKAAENEITIGPNGHLRITGITVEGDATRNLLRDPVDVEGPNRVEPYTPQKAEIEPPAPERPAFPDKVPAWGEGDPAEWHAGRFANEGGNYVRERIPQPGDEIKIRRAANNRGYRYEVAVADPNAPKGMRTAHKWKKTMAEAMDEADRIYGALARQRERAAAKAVIPDGGADGPAPNDEVPDDQIPPLHEGGSRGATDKPRTIPEDPSDPDEDPDGPPEESFPDSGTVGPDLRYDNEPDALVLSGKTFQHKDDIKKAGFRWNGPRKVWNLLTKDREERKAALQRLRKIMGLPEKDVPETNVEDPEKVKTALPEEVEEYPPTDQQQAIIDAVDTGEDVVVRALAGTGKALRHDQPVLTPGGFREIGSLHPGDPVIGRDGLTYDVLGVYPQGRRDLFEVTFSDGTTVVADAEHRWLVQRVDERSCGLPGKVRTTAEMAAHLTTPTRNTRGGTGRRAYWFMPMCEPVKFDSTDTPIDPWLLGVLLGDGHIGTGSVTVSTADEEILSGVTAATTALGLDVSHNSSYDYRITVPSGTRTAWPEHSTVPGRSRGVYNPLVSELRAMGLRGCDSSTKFIPDNYKYGDIDTRVAVLQGLFDTDGCRSGQAVDYGSVSRRLAEDVQFMVQSLGGTAVLSEKKTAGQLFYRLYIKMPPSIVPFRLSRKASGWTGGQRPPYRAVTSIKPVESDEAVCIEVASPDHLFLTAGFVPTHNTSTLKMIARRMLKNAPDKHIAYIAFNKAVQTEAEASMPRNVEARTANSLAYRTMSKGMIAKYKDRTRLSRLSDIADYLGLRKPLNLLGEAPLSVEDQVRIARKTVENFLKSDADVIGPIHLDPRYRDTEAESSLIYTARQIWEDNQREDGRIAINQDHFIKMWALTRPDLTKTSSGVKRPVDVIFFDECQPPGTLVTTTAGAVKIEDLVVGDRVVSYDMTCPRFRMKGSRILGISSRPFDGDLIRVFTTGDSKELSTRYTPNHRTIAKVGPAFDGKSLVYVMRRGDSWRVGVTSSHHGKSRRVSGVAGRLREEQADAIWVLDAFEDKRDALILEATVSARYGLPMMRFRDSGHRSIGQDVLDRFWDGLGSLTENAEACLREFGRDVRYPLTTREFTDSGSRTNYLLYTRSTVVYASNLMTGMQMLDADAVITNDRQATCRNGSEWVPVVVEREPYVGDVWSMTVERDRTYIGDGFATHNCQDINPVLAKVIKDQDIQVIAVGDSNQAIYGFRGAVDQMDKMVAPHDLALTKSWRFGPQIAAMGNRFLQLLGAKHRIEGGGPEGVVLPPGSMRDPDAILVRSNAGAINEILREQGNGRLVGVPKGTKQELLTLINTADWLKNGGRPPREIHQDLAPFRNWDEVERAAAEGDDPKVRMLYKIVEDNGLASLRDLVSRLIDTSDKDDTRVPDVVVSTAHKAKGLEWDKVRIGDDFRGPRIDKETGETIMPSPEEMRLAYVAVTRAMKELDPGSLSWVYDYTDADEEIAPEPVLEPEPAPISSTISADDAQILNDLYRGRDVDMDEVARVEKSLLDNGLILSTDPNTGRVRRYIWEERNGYRFVRHVQDDQYFTPEQQDYMIEILDRLLDVNPDWREIPRPDIAWNAGHVTLNDRLGRMPRTNNPHVYADMGYDPVTGRPRLRVRPEMFDDEWMNAGGGGFRGSHTDFLIARADGLTTEQRRMGILAHEIGHYLDRYTAQYKPDISNLARAFASEVKNGIPRWRGDPLALKPGGTARSIYASTSIKEWFAEAYSDVAINGENASWASRELVRLLTGHLADDEITPPKTVVPEAPPRPAPSPEPIPAPEARRGVEIRDLAEVHRIVNDALESDNDIKYEERDLWHNMRLDVLARDFGRALERLDEIESLDDVAEPPAALRVQLEKLDLIQKGQDVLFESAPRADGYDIPEPAGANDRFAEFLRNDDNARNDFYVNLAEVESIAQAIRPEARSIIIDAISRIQDEHYFAGLGRLDDIGSDDAYEDVRDALRDADLLDEFQGNVAAVLEPWRAQEQKSTPAPPLQTRLKNLLGISEEYGALDLDYGRRVLQDEAVRDNEYAFVDSIDEFINNNPNPDNVPSSAMDDVRNIQILMRDGKYGEAFEAFEKAVDDYPGIFQRLLLDDYDKARADYLAGRVEPKIDAYDPVDAEPEVGDRLILGLDNGIPVVVRGKERDGDIVNWEFQDDEGNVYAVPIAQDAFRDILFKDPGVPLAPVSRAPMDPEILNRNPMSVGDIVKVSGDPDDWEVIDITESDPADPGPRGVYVALQRPKGIDRTLVWIGEPDDWDLMFTDVRKNGGAGEVIDPNPDDPGPELTKDPGPAGDGGEPIDPFWKFPRLRGLMERAKRGLGVGNLADRYGVDRAGNVVFAQDAVVIPAANRGRLPKGDRPRRPAADGFIVRIEAPKDAPDDQPFEGQFAVVAVYDEAYVDKDHPRVDGIKNGDPVYYFDHVPIKDLVKIPPEDARARALVDQFGEDLARRFAGRNAGRIAPLFGRVKPIIDRIAGHENILDRVQLDRNGNPFAAGDVVKYDGKRYLVVRLNMPWDNGGNPRVVLQPLEGAVGGRREPLAREVEFFAEARDAKDINLEYGGNVPAGLDDLRNKIINLRGGLKLKDGDAPLDWGQKIRDAVDSGDLDAITSALLEDENGAVAAFMEAAENYLNKMRAKILEANRLGNPDLVEIGDEEQMNRVLENYLLMRAAMTGLWVTGDGAGRRVARRKVAGHDYAGNRPIVKFRRVWNDFRNDFEAERLANPGLVILTDANILIKRIGQKNLDDPVEFDQALDDLRLVQVLLASRPALKAQAEEAERLIGDWADEQAARRAGRGGGPGAPDKFRPEVRTPRPDVVDLDRPAPTDIGDRIRVDISGSNIIWIYHNAALSPKAKEAYNAINLDEPISKEQARALRADVLRVRGKNPHRVDGIVGKLDDAFPLTPAEPDVLPGPVLAPGDNPIERLTKDEIFFLRGRLGIIARAYGKNVTYFSKVRKKLLDASNPERLSAYEIDNLIGAIEAHLPLVKNDGARNQYQAILDKLRGVVPPAPAVPAPSAPGGRPYLDDEDFDFMGGKRAFFARRMGMDRADFDAFLDNLHRKDPVYRDDLGKFIDQVQARHDHHVGMGNLDEADQYQRVLDHIGGGGGGTGAPPVPAPSLLDKDEAVARLNDIFDSEFDRLRAGKDREGAREVRGIERRVMSKLEDAEIYHEGRNTSDRDILIQGAYDGAESISNETARRQVQEAINGVIKRFKRDDFVSAASGYLREAEKNNDDRNLDKAVRQRMLDAAQAHLDRFGDEFPDAKAELQKELDDLKAKFEADDKRRIPPVGRTIARDDLDKQIEAREKEFRRARDDDNADRVLDAGDAIAEALDKAEEAHKAGDKAGRDSALDEARAALPDLRDVDADLADQAEKAIEGNAARFAAADNAPPAAAGSFEDLGNIPAARTDINIPPSQTPGDMEDAAHALIAHGLTFADMEGYWAKPTAPAGWEIKRLGGGSVGGAHLLTHKATGKKYIVKGDNISPLGLEAEEDTALLYRALGLHQPKVYRLRAENDGNDIILMDFVGQYDDDVRGTPQLFNRKGLNEPSLSALGVTSQERKNEILALLISNGILGQSDRHPDNIMWIARKDGEGQVYPIDNGLMWWNAVWRDDADNERENSQSPWLVHPLGMMLGGRGNSPARGGRWGNTNQIQYAAREVIRGMTRDEGVSFITQWAERMRREAMARRTQFRNTGAADWVNLRAQWVIDHADEVYMGLKTGRIPTTLPPIPSVPSSW